jgi:hypothetical protein
VRLVTGYETLRERRTGGDGERQKAISLAKAAKLAKEIQNQRQEL